MHHGFLSQRPTLRRLARFACTGGGTTALQLALLHLWTQRGWDALAVNIAAFFVAAQVNFLLSARFTWADRRDPTRPRASLPRCWAAYHGSIISTAILNQAVFALARGFLPLLLASLLGTATAGLINYVMLDRVIFTPRGATP